MDRFGKRAGRHFAAHGLCVLAICALAAGGCTSLRLPRIDPSGERIFLPAPEYTTPVVPSCQLPGAPRPAFAAPQTPPPCGDIPPFAPPEAYPGAVAPPVTAPPPYANPTRPGWLHGHGRKDAGAAVRVTPARLVAPVGKEVVLLAGLCGSDGYFRTRETIEWNLTQESVGAIVDVGEDPYCSVSRLYGKAPQKKAVNFALGRTSTTARLISRGTADQSDDVWLLAGQTWVSVVSAVEGTSHVAAIAPDAADWDRRQQFATIHWVDGQWVVPPPAIVRAGQRHALTTTVTRQTNAAPVPGWLVRYEVVDGPPAGFAPAGALAVEVMTDSSGNATAELTPQTSAPGQTRIRVQIIRPGMTAADLPKLVVGEGWTSVSWSAPGLSVRTTGPDVAEINSIVTYRVEVSNPGDLSTPAVTVSDALPPQLAFVSSNPQAQLFGNRLQWQLGDLQPLAVRVLEINCRAQQPGLVRNCVTASSQGGMNTESCAATNIFRPSLSVEMTGPDTAKMGEPVQYRVTVTNVGDGPLLGVLVTDNFDLGLEHPEAVSPIVRELGDLAAGESRRFAITFTTRQSGQLCHRLEVTARGGQTATARACVMVSEPPPLTRPEPPNMVPPAGAPPTTVTPPSGTPAAPARPAVEVNASAPPQARVGETALFTITVKNTGNVPLSGIRIADQYTATLNPTNASPGYALDRVQLTMTWLVERLDPGQSLNRQVQFQCLAPEPRACNRVTVTSAQNASMFAEACLVVQPAGGTAPPLGPGVGTQEPPPTGNLTLTVTDEGDPVRAGQRVTYLVVIKNDRNVSDKKVALTLHLPDLLRMESVSGPVSQFSRSPDGRTVAVTPVEELRAGETVAFRIQTTAMRAGRAVFQAEVSSLRLEKPLSAQEDTTILVE